jgi:FKBP-type peptidyl-prolyl cis-trans isomerase (trigger factor)
MRSFQETLSIFNDNTADLLNQFSELNELRERLRKAEQSALKVRQSKRRKKTPIEHEAHPGRQIADRTI